MLDEVVAAGPEAVGRDFYDRMVSNERTGRDATRTRRRAGRVSRIAASDGITGRLLSAVWDPWEDLAGRRDDLEGSDVYTLRRIVPKDRGFTWGDR